MLNKLSKAAVYIEGTIFPAVFIFFGIRNFFNLYLILQTYFSRQSGMSGESVYEMLLSSRAAMYLMLTVFDSLIAYSLIFRKNLKQYPDNFKEILIPLLATFGNMSYNLIPNVPDVLNDVFLPEKYLVFSKLTGTLLTIAGIGTASCAIFTLRKSFAVFVQVREIITSGLFAHVRHPIYLGHIIAFIGFVFIEPRWFALLLCVFTVSVTLYRAYLEEQKLAKFSEQYRAYKEKTPFIIPFKRDRGNNL